MKQNIKKALSFYITCNKLKDTIRKGPSVWNTRRDRIESVADHIYGVQMLAISIYYQFQYKLDINKIIYMLAVHELVECIIGDLAFYEITPEEKEKKSQEALETILKDFLGQKEIKALIDEFDNQKTEEAIFAYHCDKLENDIQMKLYEQEGALSIKYQENNPIIDSPKVKPFIDAEDSISNAWLEFDRHKLDDDPIFIEILEYLKGNDI